METNNSSQVSSLKVILMGELIVNAPVTLAIIASFVLLLMFKLGWHISLIIATGIGWFLWSKMLDIWIRWALNNNVDRERLFKLGKYGLINFYRYRIFDYEYEKES